MFCPNCGSEERQLSQYCRGCGMDLRVVRTGLERSDQASSTADDARAEIGRAIAERIRELKTGRELVRLTNHVLPRVDRFLESAEEKRLRRMRAGLITSSVGLGGILMFMMIALASGKEVFLVPAAAAMVTLIIGLGVLISGKMLSVPKKKFADSSEENLNQEIADRMTISSVRRNEIRESSNPPLSVVEHTTHRLAADPVKDRRP